MNLIAIKSCPFCGSAASLEENGSYDRGYGYVVACMNRKCAGACGSGLLCYRTKDEAIAAWNCRSKENSTQLEGIEKNVLSQLAIRLGNGSFTRKDINEVKYIIECLGKIEVS